MLPVIGVVAIGLLVIGIKLFFFPDPQTPVLMAIPERASETDISKQEVSPPLANNPIEVSDNFAQPVETHPKVKPAEAKKPAPILAVPVTGKEQAAPKIDPTQKITPTTVTTKKESSESTSAKTTNGTSTTVTQETQATWGVQVGAFTAKESASSVLSKVKAQGFACELNQAQVNGKIFYRVRVLSGNSKESATAMAQKLKNKGYPTLVVPLTR